MRFVAHTANADANSGGNPAVCTPLPAGTPFLPGPIPPNVPPVNVTCSGLDIGPRSSVTFQMAFLVDPMYLVTAVAGGNPNGSVPELPIINRACITDTGVLSDPDLTNNCATDTDLVKDLADLRVSKYVEPEGMVRAGDIFTYTIFVDNLGPSAARTVVISDTLLNSGLVSIQSCAFSVSQGGGAITQFTCTTGSVVSTQFGSDIGTFATNFLEPLTPDSQGRLRASFRLVAKEDIDVTNTVRVTSRTPDPDTANNATSVSIAVSAVSDVSVTKQATGEEQQTSQAGLMFNNAIFGQVFPTAPNYFVSTRVTAGRRIQYQLNVRNDGPSEAENVVVMDRLPFGVRIYQGSLAVVVDNTGTPNPPPVTLPAGACTTGTPGAVLDQLKCGLGVLQSGATATITFQVITDASLAAGTVLENDALVYSDSFDVDNTDNMANAQNTVLTASDLSVAKSAVGEEVTGYDATLHAFQIAEATNRVTAGKILRYQIQVQNSGPCDSLNVTLQEDLPVPVVIPALPTEAVTFLWADGASCRPSSWTRTDLLHGGVDGGRRAHNVRHLRAGQPGGAERDAAAELGDGAAQRVEHRPARRTAGDPGAGPDPAVDVGPVCLGMHEQQHGHQHHPGDSRGGRVHRRRPTCRRRRGWTSRSSRTRRWRARSTAT